MKRWFMACVFGAPGAFSETAGDNDASYFGNARSSSAAPRPVFHSRIFGTGAIIQEYEAQLRATNQASPAGGILMACTRATARCAANDELIALARRIRHGPDPVGSSYDSAAAIADCRLGGAGVRTIAAPAQPAVRRDDPRVLALVTEAAGSTSR